MSFFDKLAAQQSKQGHQLCAGIDLHINRAEWGRHLAHWGCEELLWRGACAVVEACTEKLKVFKLQMAFFEAHGLGGFAALKKVCDFIHSQNGIVILDGKRGDIASTMHAYGEMAFDYFGADALTVLPYMGISVLDALKPWLGERGIYVVWVSSNADGQAWQQPIQSTIVRDCIEWRQEQRVGNCLGFVLGATKVQDLAQGDWHSVQREPMLLPGFGAQGASMTVRHREILQQSPASCFPISRGLCDFSALKQSAPHAWEEEIKRSVTAKLGAWIHELSP